MGLIKINLAADGGKEVKVMLKKLPKELRARAFKNALNKTAKDCMKLVAKDTQNTYAIKQRAFKDSKYKSVRIHKARENNLQAIVHINSHKTELYDYTVSPAKYNPKSRPEIYRGRALKGGMKALWETTKGYRAKGFVVKYRSGHVTIAARTGQPSKKDPKKDGIATMFAPAISQLIGARRIRKVLEPEINELLASEVNKEIRRMRSRGIF